VAVEEAGLEAEREGLRQEEEQDCDCGQRHSHGTTVQALAAHVKRP
jgi:hypothetical protein